MAAPLFVGAFGGYIIFLLLKPNVRVRFSKNVLFCYGLDWKQGEDKDDHDHRCLERECLAEPRLHLGSLSLGLMEEGDDARAQHHVVGHLEAGDAQTGVTDVFKGVKVPVHR